MANGLRHSLAAEPIKGPKEHAVEFALRGVIEQGGELLASVGTFRPLTCSTYSRLIV